MNSIDLLEKRKIKKVAILGAGASADAGAPTISNFWDKIDELITQGKFNESEFSKINNIKQKREQLLMRKQKDKEEKEKRIQKMLESASKNYNIPEKDFNRLTSKTIATQTREVETKLAEVGQKQNNNNFNVINLQRKFVNLNLNLIFSLISSFYKKRAIPSWRQN